MYYENQDFTSYLFYVASGAKSYAEAMCYHQLKEKYGHIKVSKAEAEIGKIVFLVQRQEHNFIKDAEKWLQSDYRVKDEQEYWADL